jgi:hypothetical protein
MGPFAWGAARDAMQGARGDPGSAAIAAAMAAWRRDRPA